MEFRRLKEIRVNNNLTQEEVAKILGIDRTTYASFEIGRDTISIERLNIFTNYFKTSFDYIFELTDTYNYNIEKEKIEIQEVAKRLKESRKNNKMTQEYIAKKLNTAHSVWCRYEQGKYLIKTSFLFSYAKTLGISADYLLGKVNNPQNLFWGFYNI